MKYSFCITKRNKTYCVLRLDFDGLLGGWKRFLLFSTHVLFDSPNASRDSWIVETVARLLNVPSCVVSPDRRNPLKKPWGKERSIFITPSWYFDASRSSWLFGSGEMIPTIDGPAAFNWVLKLYENNTWKYMLKISNPFLCQCFFGHSISMTSIHYILEVE